MDTVRRFDVAKIKASYDLRDYVAADNVGPGYVRAAYTMFKCPFHDDHTPSLGVRKQDYRCFACGETGDLLTWVMKRDFANYDPNIAFVKACEKLGGESSDVERLRVERARSDRQSKSEMAYKSGQVPSEAFQNALNTVIDQAVHDLHETEPGIAALSYLTKTRGLRPGTIEQARLGYIFQGDGPLKEKWKEITGDLKLKLAFREGITFPWIAGKVSWGIKVRRSYAPSKDKRYTQITAADEVKSPQYRPELSSGLYWADQLARGMPGFLIEGEINCLTIWQEARDMVNPVSLGAAQEMIDQRWLLSLARCKGLLALYDPDKAGEIGAARAQKLSKQFFLTSLNVAGDINDLHTTSLKSGQLGAVSDWVKQMLDTYWHVMEESKQ